MRRIWTQFRSRSPFRSDLLWEYLVWCWDNCEWGITVWWSTTGGQDQNIDVWKKKKSIKHNDWNKLQVENFWLQFSSQMTIYNHSDKKSTRAVNIPETLIEHSDCVVKLYQQHTQSLLVFIYWFLPISHDSSPWRDHCSGRNASCSLNSVFIFYTCRSVVLQWYYMIKKQYNKWPFYF